MKMTKNINTIVGLIMKQYRRSFLYPRAGKILARLLTLIVSPIREKKVLKSIDGINYELDLNQVIDASLYYSGVYEEKAENVINKYVKEDMIALDIGANFGYHTFRMAKKVGKGKVVAFEPTSWAYSKLVRNWELNEMHNIRFHKIALSDQNYGQIQVAFQSSYPLTGKSENQFEQIHFYKLDTIIEQEHLNRLDFIKLDVDGFESKVIKGAKCTLEKFHPIILFEYSPKEISNNGDVPIDILKYLEGIDYTLLNDSEQEINDLNDYSNQIQNHRVSNLLLAIPRKVKI